MNNFSYTGSKRGPGGSTVFWMVFETCFLLPKLFWVPDIFDPEAHDIIPTASRCSGSYGGIAGITLARLGLWEKPRKARLFSNGLRVRWFVSWKISRYIAPTLRVLLHLLRRCELGWFGGLNPFSGGTWTLRATKKQIL